MARMRDGIMIAGRTWRDFNILERLGRSATHLGAQVLYRADPMSRFKQNYRA
jgi:hypothetical protein